MIPPFHHPLWKAVFWAPSALFGGVVRARARAYRAGWLETVRVPVPVLCVGNPTVGGSGKTPVTLWLAERLKDQGRRPALVTRGYGRAGDDVALVTNREGRDLPETAVMGDEPRLLAQRLPGVPLAIGVDRAQAAEQAVAAFSPDCVIMDDGLQHFRLYRDRNLVCLDARLAHDHWVRGRRAFLLPAGPWRETPRALERASALLLTRVERLEVEERRALERALQGLGLPLGWARYRISFKNYATGDSVPVEFFRDRPVLALTGLADPSSFEGHVAALGARVASQRHRDHHTFDEADLSRAQARARLESRTLVTTEKDAQRLPEGFPALVARLDLDWEDTAWTFVVDSVFASKPAS